MSEKSIKKHLGFLRGVSDVIRLVQLRAGRDVRIEHQEVQPFFAVFLVEGGEEHAAGFETHHRSGRQVRVCNERLADELFRLVIGVNAR